VSCRLTPIEQFLSCIIGRTS